MGFLLSEYGDEYIESLSGIVSGFAKKVYASVAEGLSPPIQAIIELSYPAYKVIDKQVEEVRESVQEWGAKIQLQLEGEVLEVRDSIFDAVGTIEHQLQPIQYSEDTGFQLSDFWKFLTGYKSKIK